MSPRRYLTGMARGVLVLAFLFLALPPVSGANLTSQSDGSMTITVEIPNTEPPPPFDWNWQYPAPTCDGVTVVFPVNLPLSQQGVMEIGVVGGSVSGMLYKLEGQAYQATYPNGHAGQAVFIPWSEFRNNQIPPMDTWTVDRLKVHGTNYHWQGNLTCGVAATAQPEGDASETS